MTELDCGIFNEFWNGLPNHMPFLGLNANLTTEWNLTKSLNLLNDICDCNDDEKILEGIFKLINTGNYRTYLVAILASFKISNSAQQNLIPDFWNIASKNSKATTRILSVLSIIDKNFDSKIKKNDNTELIFKKHIENYLLTEKNELNWKKN